jgi:hypothetical protein
MISVANLSQKYLKEPVFSITKRKCQNKSCPYSFPNQTPECHLCQAEGVWISGFFLTIQGDPGQSRADWSIDPLLQYLWTVLQYAEGNDLWGKNPTVFSSGKYTEPVDPVITGLFKT